MSVPSVAIEKNLEANFQEQEFVHSVYNDIASHFSQTRYKPWPIVEDFLKTRPDYSIGLDVGCGNGKYLGVNEKLFMIGTDRSDGLVKCGHEISKGKYQLGVADGLNLPHENGKFDFAISIAVIHHFANEDRRIEAIRHILSKLRKGGELLVYCWALEQENSRRGYKEGDEQDILIPWVLQKKQEKKPKAPKQRKSKKKNDLESGISALEIGTGELKPEVHEQPKAEIEDAEVKEQQKAEEPEVIGDEDEKAKQDQTKYRYYHLYKKGELHENALRAGGVVVREGYEKDNWWCVIKNE